MTGDRYFLGGDRFEHVFQVHSLEFSSKSVSHVNFFLKPIHAGRWAYWGRDLTWFSLLKFFLSLQRVYKEMAQFIFFDVDGDTLCQNQLSQETAKGWQGEGHLVKPDSKSSLHFLVETKPAVSHSYLHVLGSKLPSFSDKKWDDIPQYI